MSVVMTNKLNRLCTYS